ncbi:MAG: 50S ribosomal protein L4 [Candidatus Omnitrophota bacterium]
MKKSSKSKTTKAVKTAKVAPVTRDPNLNPAIFDGKVNKNVLYQVITMYQANKRQGNASTKTRADVRGGSRKPWRQKGTGRARVGSTRSPLWKGGGTIFGPHPRDYSYTLSKNIRTLALRSSLNAKMNANALVVVDDVTVETPKTKEFKKILVAHKIDTKVLFVLDKIDHKVTLASRNLGEVALMRAEDINALDVLTYKKIVVTKPALSVITRRLSSDE